MTSSLEQKYNFFLSHLEEFSKSHLNQFVLIKGEKAFDFFTSYENALRAGLTRFGNVPFFIEEVKREEDVHCYHQGID